MSLTGMRPIVNLGRGSRVTFRSASARRSRALPAQHTILSFRPVNFHLQQLHRVSPHLLSHALHLPSHIDQYFKISELLMAWPVFPDSMTHMV